MYKRQANDDDGTCLFPGCLDSDAENYDPNANVDDETCQYGGCIDSSASNYDETADVDDGSCLYPGCTDSAADNFDPGANDEDGSCIYFGCMDPVALNFEVFASVDDGSCFYGGCLDPTACNYDAEADVEDGSCTYPTASNVDCDGVCYNDADGDGVCDEDEFSGCTDPEACNYNPIMTEDDGSCDYCSCAIEGTAGLSSFDYASNTDGYGLRLERVVDHTSGALAGMTTWHVIATVANADDMLSSVYGNETLPLVISSTTSFHQDPMGATFASGINPMLFSFFADLSYDSWVTVGIEGTPDGALGQGDVQLSLIHI